MCGCLKASEYRDGLRPRTLRAGSSPRPVSIRSWLRGSADSRVYESLRLVSRKGRRVLTSRTLRYPTGIRDSKLLEIRSLQTAAPLGFDFSSFGFRLRIHNRQCAYG